MDIKENYLYTKEHEWVNIEEGEAYVGISEYAQSSLGDITFIELPQVDDEVEQFGELASIESVKAASDIYSPLSGKIVEINEDLEDDPSVMNKFCYEEGWIAKIKFSDEEEISNLMTADEYSKYLISVD